MGIPLGSAGRSCSLSCIREELEQSRAQGEEELCSPAPCLCVCFWGGSLLLNVVPGGTKTKFLVRLGQSCCLFTEGLETAPVLWGFLVPMNHARHCPGSRGKLTASLCC